MAKNQRACWGVIFDVDGTMVDNTEYHRAAWVELGARYNKSITGEFYREHIHAQTNDSIVRAIFGNVSNETIDKISSEKELIYRESYRPVIKEICGLTNLLKSLKSEAVPCAAASNSPKGNVDMVLDELDIRRYFDVVINNDEVSKGKPDPEVLLTAAAQSGLPPEKCVVFEDSVSGFRAAANARMPFIAITAHTDPHILDFIANRPAHADFTKITLADIKAMADQ